MINCVILLTMNAFHEVYSPSIQLEKCKRFSLSQTHMPNRLTQGKPLFFKKNALGTTKKPIRNAHEKPMTQMLKAFELANTAKITNQELLDRVAK